MRQAVILGALVVAVISAFGCSTVQRSPQREIVVADNLVIADLPVPGGFKIDNSRSFFSVVPGSSTRIVFVTYTGRGDALRLMDFFRQNMAISGWKIKSEAGDFGAYVLRFDKDREAAEVRIIPGRFSTEFTVALNPKPAD